MLNKRYFSTLFLAVALGALSFGFTACDDDDPALPGTGIESAQWSAVNDADIDGDLLIYEFESPASWTASSTEDWCQVITTSGFKGLSSLRIKVDQNEGKLGRSADVKVQIAGYAEPCVLTIRQGDGVLEKGPGRFREVNQWTYDIMSEYYLWNDRIPELILDHSLDYDYFFNSILTGVAEFDDVNHDDGYWIDGTRAMFYSNLQSNYPLSRAAGETFNDAGLLLRASILGANDDDPCGFAVLWVTPGSAAESAGVRRGDFIDKVNNVAVTQSNYKTLGQQLLNGNVTVTLNDVTFNNGVATVTPRAEAVTISRKSYVDPAIYKSSILQTTNNKKIGYLLYMNFHMDYDTQLLEIFDQFKAQGINELVVDLRYNNGGHVLSSTVLGTLVAGSAHQGEIYLRTTYNSKRTAAGEVGEYKIGEAANPEVAQGYDKIASAITSSLGLSRVYVIGTENTASASELFINGLRGMGITVNLIGTDTQGKNCGMEGWQKRMGNYSFVLYPITFYCENGQGFRDYGDGFAPDLYIDDSTIYPGEFGTMADLLSAAAIKWASTGVKPSEYSTQARGNASNMIALPSDETLDAPMTRRPGGSRTQIKNL